MLFNQPLPRSQLLEAL